MTKTVHMASQAITALLLAAALSLSGILVARQITESELVQQSKIIRSIFSDLEGESVGMTSVLTDSRSREVLFKFVGAVANAYVSFELIPINEAATFAAVYESLGPVAEIEEFAYHRRNLTIAGTCPTENDYREFMRRLRAQSYFEGVTGHFYVTVDDLIRFEIECVAAE